MKDFKSEMKELLKSDLDDSTLKEFRKMSSFIDSALANAFKLSGDERAQFLVTNMLNMRTYMASEVTRHTIIEEYQSSIVKLYDDSLSEPVKKKEEELKEEEHLPESLSEIDPLM